MVRTYSIFLIFLLLVGCAVQTKQAEPVEPVDSNSFLAQPFSYPLTLQYFQEEKKDDFKLRRFIRTLGSDTTRKDTIYKFSRKKDSYLFYKTRDHKSFFLTATLKNKQTHFRGGLHPGMKKTEFMKQITGITSAEDTLKIQSSERQAIFIFGKSGQLTEIQLNNYFK